MRWIVGRIISFFLRINALTMRGLILVAVAIGAALRGLYAMSVESRRLREESHRVSADLAAWTTRQRQDYPFPAEKPTIFLLITCGQAVRNFLLSDVLMLLKQKFNVVILTPYAYSASFRQAYLGPGVHVLPWFENFRTTLEKFFQYYQMKMSLSRTHASWLANLEDRAKSGGANRTRFYKHLALRRSSDAAGRVLGRKRMQGLYASYFHAYLDKSMFAKLFSAYRPALVISTTAHHAEAWPLTYHAQNNGCRTLAHILSWDNPTTKPTMDTSCDVYTVWSPEMQQEMAQHFPHLKTTTVVTGTPLFDLYYKRPGAEDRSAFLAGLGLDPALPYVLWTTNTPSGMPDENIIVREFWLKMQLTPMAGKVSLLVRLHPKELEEKYQELRAFPNVALTNAGDPHWGKSDRWLPDHGDMRLLVNSMIHAAVSINVASTMSLESFAVGLPTINVAFKSTKQIKDHGLLWSFDMYHASDHYRALVENGAVDIVRSMDALIASTIEALRDGTSRQEAMRKTLDQKAAHCDGTAARRFCEAVEHAAMPSGAGAVSVVERPPEQGPVGSLTPQAVQ